MRCFLEAVPDKSRLLDYVSTFNIWRALQPFLSQGYYIDPHTHKITCRNAVDATRNWIFVNPDPNRQCNLYQAMHSNLKFVPSRCMNCWKVVVKLKNIKQLFALLDWQLEWTKKNEGKSRFCKCGIEERPWVHYQYGGYFYCDSYEQGQARHKEVKQAMDKLFPEGVLDVTLKRYCTEMELQCGPTDQYIRPPAADQWESLVFEAFDLTKIARIQPLYLQQDIFFRWLEFAWDRGDKTAIEFNQGKPYYTQCVTYHDKETTNV